MTQLNENIRLLGDLLGQTIREQSGPEVYEIVERIRTLCKAWRSGDHAAKEEVHQVIRLLVGDLALTSDVVKAFSTYFQLVNLAEEHERIRILYERASTAHSKQVPMDESIMAAVEALKQQGFAAEQVEAMMKDMLIVPVFTAHPTESRRRTTRRILEHLSDSLRDLRSGATYSHQLDGIQAQLSAAITLLWQSNESRKRKPTVMDEVRNTGLYFFEHTLFEVVPQIYEELERAVAKHFADPPWDVPSMLQFSSWIGGDRDGNPFVTNPTTESAIQAQMELVLERYANDVQALYELLSPARNRASFNIEFLTELDAEIAALPDSELTTIERFDQEPYRQKLILVYRRLLATIAWSQQGWQDSVPDERAYRTSDELLRDLTSIDRSLRENKGASLAYGPLSRLIRRVRVFGFHLASLDVRQHSRKHEAALAEIFASHELPTLYTEQSELKRIEILTRETANQRPLTAKLNYSADCNQTISLFRLIKQAHLKAGPDCVQSYIISMTANVSDVLEVLLLMSDAELFGQLDVVPLFETVDDLQAAPEILSGLFANEVYKEHLARRGNRQQIMIGYSDSNKDGGFLRANWMLFTAQRKMAETCSKHDVGLVFFHGRGGSIGRGGGPANRAILSQPSESIRGRIRVTEQGEVVSSRYTHPEIALRHLQQLFHAVICSSGRHPEFSRIERWSEIMDQLSILAFQAYRQLIERPEFLDFFQATTPIEHIDHLNLGSRPSRRRITQAIADLRAIPWVFAWTQSRTGIPSWYGVGTAFERWVTDANDQERLGELREMYREWPFFRILMDNIHVGLGRADLEIAELYSGLFQDEHREDLPLNIRHEFELSREYVLRVTGHSEILDTEKWLQHSIRMRNPYVDPMHTIQVALIERCRECDNDSDKAALQDVILQSINGIAAGLQSVG